MRLALGAAVTSATLLGIPVWCALQFLTCRANSEHWELLWLVLTGPVGVALASMFALPIVFAAWLRDPVAAASAWGLHGLGVAFVAWGLVADPSNVTLGLWTGGLGLAVWVAVGLLAVRATRVARSQPKGS